MKFLKHSCKKKVIFFQKRTLDIDLFNLFRTQLYEFLVINPFVHEGVGALYDPPPALFFCPLLQISLGNPWQLLDLQTVLLRLPL